jgi:hypothetical protein
MQAVNSWLSVPIPDGVLLQCSAAQCGACCVFAQLPKLVVRVALRALTGTHMTSNKQCFWRWPIAAGVWWRSQPTCTVACETCADSLCWCLLLIWHSWLRTGHAA